MEKPDSSVSTPWLTAREAAAYAKTNYRSIMEAARKKNPETGEPELQSTKQGDAKNGKRVFHVTWVDAWLMKRATGSVQ